MDVFNQYIAQGHGWLFFPMAILLGALHGLEPGHSKTMMTAFIVAIRGTAWQAFLLGVSATISHTAVIWILAIIGLHYGSNLNIEELEPYFQLATGVVVIGLAIWMLYRTYKAEQEVKSHRHDHDSHDDMIVNTGHGWVQITIFETGVPPRFRLYLFDKNKTPINVPSAEGVTIETIRPNRARQNFYFIVQENYLEATTFLPEPHEFQAVLGLKHGDHAHTWRINFTEHHYHPQLDQNDLQFGDAHERAHAAEMQKQLTNREVTTGQIILFGLTGGLLPCPSAFAVLLVCLQLKKVSLGFALVLGFSIGLAITLVTVGTLAAFSVKHASKKFKGFGEFARKVPYASSTVLILIGLLVAIQGLRHLL